jgi:hypothetical protein
MLHWMAATSAEKGNKIPFSIDDDTLGGHTG